MSIDRRELLKAGLAVSAAAALPHAARAEAGFAPQPGAWRNFAVLTRLEIVKADGKTQAWIPVPAVNERGLVQVARQRLDEQRPRRPGARAEIRRRDASCRMAGG